MTDPELGPGRERTVEALCEHFARDALTVEEFERRVDRAHRAETTEELRALLRDLPGGMGVIEAREEASVVDGREADVPAGRVRERSTVLAVCGGNKRRGRWIPARRTLSVAVCGGVKLDFREASLGPGITEVHAMALCGGVEIVVPPGMAVESEGFAILGGFENVDTHPASADPEGPVLRVRGFALCGSVGVSVRHPGESQGEARRRVREERRRKRRLRRGDG